MRSDTQLQHDVLAELEQEPSIDASKIGIAAKSGVVTLSGTVRFQPQKILTELIVKDVPGVKAVVDNIDVRYPGIRNRNDTDIAMAALKSLKMRISIPDRLKVTVQNGRVKLEGEVDWQFQRDAAGDAVRVLAGVKGVNNAITISTDPRPKDVRAKAGAKLHVARR